MPELVVRVGTRSSHLALWQANHVIERLEGAPPGLRCERVPIRTLGDRVKDVPLPRFGDRGLFTREIESALRAGTIDVAVHSLKDLPTDEPKDLTVAAVLEREDARDVLVSATGASLDSLPAGARVGTSSMRRRAQILAHRPDLQLLDIRGNVPTRLEKVRRGDYDATLLALAGLKRLGLAAAASELFAVDRLLPAPGQGALAAQVRTADVSVREAVSRLDHVPTRQATSAERALLTILDGGCQAPLGAFAGWTATGCLSLDAIVLNDTGTRVLRAAGERPVESLDDALALAAKIAALLDEQGAGAILAACRQKWSGESRPSVEELA